MNTTPFRDNGPCFTFFFSAAICCASHLSAQEVTRVERTIILPRVRGTTALSAEISARAEAIDAAGRFLLNRAEARKTNAEAVSKEMDNAVKWVDTYFGKQELNRMYRKAKNPPYLDRIYKRYQATQRKILQSPGEILKEDPTRYLNWMLNELSTAEIALAAPTDRTSIGTTLDQNLPDDALHHIRLTDGKSNGTSGLVFRADTGQVFDERWPYLLRDPDFAPTRERAERAQQAFLGEIGEQGEFSLNSAQELRTSIDELAALYARKYPFEEVLRSEDRELIRFYWIGRRFLQQRAANAARAIITNDLRVLDGTFRIEDTSVVTLIRNLCQNGLQFAPPTPGDEPTYRDLFRKMRHIYEDHADRTARFDASPIQN